jgi:hypothetical protein
MSKVFKLWLGFSHRLIFALITFYERIDRWYALAVIAISVALMLALKILLPSWAVLLVVGILWSSFLGVVGSMYILYQRLCLDGKIGAC